jgi:hypothetical protein
MCQFGCYFICYNFFNMIYGEKLAVLCHKYLRQQTLRKIIEITLFNVILKIWKLFDVAVWASHFAIS